MKNSELKKKVARLGKIGKSNTILIQEYMLFEGGYMRSSDYSTTIAEDTDIQGNGLFSIAKLKKICQAFPASTDIDIVWEGKTAMVFIDGVKKFEYINDLDISDFAPFSPMAGCKAFTANGNDILRANKYASTDELRPSMCGVFISKEHIASTDAHKMLYIKHNQEIEREFIIPSNVGKLIDKNSECTFYHVLSNDYVLKFGETTIQFKAIDDKFPNYQQVIPSGYLDRANTVIINKLLLIGELKQSLIAANETTNQVVLSVSEEKCVLSSECLDEKSSFFSSLVASVEGREMQICFNGKFLLDCVVDLPNESLEFELYAPNKAIVIDGEMLLMPVMLNR